MSLSSRVKNHPLLPLVPFDYRDKVVQFQEVGDCTRVYAKLENPLQKCEKRYIGKIKDKKFSLSEKLAIEIQLKNKEKELSTSQNMLTAVSSEHIKVGGLLEKCQKKIRELADYLLEEICGISEAYEAFCEIYKFIKKFTKEFRYVKKSDYPLAPIFAVGILATLGGQASATEIWSYWTRHLKKLRQLIDDLPGKVPSHDTINRVLKLHAPSRLHILLHWFKYLSPSDIRVLHIDGQACRAAKTEKLHKGRYFLNAFDSESGFCVGTRLVGEKTNEISAVLPLLRHMKLRPRDVVTGDAMLTQVEIATFVHQHQAFYLLPCKGNQSLTHTDLTNIFDSFKDINSIGMEHVKLETLITVDCDHGRVETREVKVMPAKDWVSPEILQKWPGLEQGCIVYVGCKSEAKSLRARESYDARVFVTNIPFEAGCAEKLGDLVRRHWSVENQLHWTLDDHFSQDRIQCKKEGYLVTRVLLNRIALNLLRWAQRYRYEKTGQVIPLSELMRQSLEPVQAIKVINDAYRSDKFTALLA